MKILDIGCGKNKYVSKNKKDKVIGIDSIKLPRVNIVHNLEKFPWPLKKNEFDLILCSQVLEHLTNTVKTMEEIWRVSKKGAIIKIWVPHFSAPVAFTDPTHKSYFGLSSFEYFTNECELNYYSKARFKILKKKLNFKIKKLGFINKIINSMVNYHPFNYFYEMFCSRIFPIHELYVELQTIK